MKIGLTGSIACGKSTVSAYLRQLGYPIVDADAISRALTAPGGDALPAVRRAFGDSVFDGEELNRRALGALVFSDAEKRDALNAILHPMIISRIQAELAEKDREGSFVFGDIPLLYECGMESMFDRIWVVSAPRETQIERLYARDGLSREEAERRIDAQMPLQEKTRRADAVIHTSASIQMMQEQVQLLLRQSEERRSV